MRNRAKIVLHHQQRAQACELVDEPDRWRGGCGRSGPGDEERPAVVDLAYWTGNPTSSASVRLSKALKKRELDLCRSAHDVCADAGDGDGQ